MQYKVFASMNIAIVGVSKIAESYARAFAHAGYNVFMAWKDSDTKGVDPVLGDISRISFCSIEEAADVADFIIIATPPVDVREVSYWLGDVRRKVIIDATSNVFTDSDDQLKTVCAIKAITGSPHVVKAFNARGYEKLIKPLFHGEQVEMILVGDCKKAKEVAKILTRELGVSNWYDFGDSASIPLFNALTTSLRNLVKNNIIVKKKKDAII